MSLAIECRGLRKIYDGKVEALRGLDLEIHEGECFGLLGPNGAGKTTSIEILESSIIRALIRGAAMRKDEARQMKPGDKSGAMRND